MRKPGDCFFSCQGKVVVTGVGKRRFRMREKALLANYPEGNAGEKITALLASRSVEPLFDERS
jgi:hypothetical protein